MKTLYLVPALALLCAAFVYPPQSRSTSQAEPASLVAPDDKALVVFARPKKTPVINFYVFDENKKLRTLFKNKEHAVITEEPGKHTYYVVAENAELVRAELAAGRTYVIHTYPRAGWGKARVDVEVARRNAPTFDESPDWLRKTAPAESDFDKGEKWTRKRQDALTRRMTGAEEDWAEMDAKEREERTLRPEDGRTAEEAKNLETR